MGPAVASLVAASIIAAFGWRTVFIVLAFPGLLIGIYCWKYVKDNPAEHGRMTPSELAEIEADEAQGTNNISEGGISFKEFLRSGGSFNTAFIFIIGALVASAVLALTVGKEAR